MVLKEAHEQLERVAVKFKMDTSLYSLENGSLSRVDGELLKRGELQVADVLYNGMYRLDNGLIAKSNVNNPAIVVHGTLYNNVEGTKVLSKNGSVLRKVEAGQEFKVFGIEQLGEFVAYRINKSEYILNQKGATFSDNVRKLVL